VIWDGHRYLFLWSSDGAFWMSALGGFPKRLLDDDGHTQIDVVPAQTGVLVLTQHAGRLFLAAFDADFKLVTTRVLDDQGSSSRCTAAMCGSPPHRPQIAD